MENLTIVTKYNSNDHEVVLETDTEHYKVDYVNNRGTTVRIFNHNPLSRELKTSGLVKFDYEDDFTYCKIYVNNDLLISLNHSDVQRIVYRLEIGTAIDSECREYVEYTILPTT